MNSPIVLIGFRRLPVVFALHKYIPQIEEKRQAIFVGFFGPIGVSAVFYLYISLEFLDGITVEGVQREDAARLADVINVVVWFLAICSIVVHGLSIPLGKLGFFLPRTLSRAFTSQGNDEAETLPIGERIRSTTVGVLRQRRSRSRRSTSGQSTPTTPTTSNAPSTRQIFRIGGSVIRGPTSVNSGSATPRDPEQPPGTPTSPPAVRGERTIRFTDGSESTRTSAPLTPPQVAQKRTVKFPDEDLPALELDNRSNENVTTVIQEDGERGLSERMRG